MKHETRSIGDLIKDSEEKSLLLPNFQREFVWDRKNNQRELLTSIIYKMPIGSLLIVEGQEGFFATKQLCFLKDESNSYQDDQLRKPEIQYLLDGQQRISTLKSIMYDLFFPDISKDNYENVYELLKTRWFIRVVPDSKKSEDDIFGYYDMDFQGQKSIDKFEPTVIKEAIEYRKVFPNDRKWWDIKYKVADWATDNYEDLYDSNRKSEIAKKAAENGLIPLFDIYPSENIKPSEKLHRKVLNIVADERIKKIQDDIADNKIAPNDLFDNKSNIEDNLNEKLDNLKTDWVTNVYDYLQHLIDEKIPVIKLEAKEMTRVIYSFEYVNRGGMNLSIYDLIVAKAAHKKGQKPLTDIIIELIESTRITLPDNLKNYLQDIDLKEWDALSTGIIREGQLIDKFKSQYLNLLSILSNVPSINDINSDIMKVEYIKKSKHLELDTNQIYEYTDKAVIALIRAYTFLQFRCGIVNIDDLKYQLMVLPIAYAFNNEEFWLSSKALNKVEYWYWSSLFSGAYRDRQNEQCIRDVSQLYQWLCGEQNPFKKREMMVFEDNGYSDLDTLLLKGEEGLSSVPTAIKEGLLQYVLSREPKDFLKDGIRLKAWELAAGKDYHTDGKTVELNVQKHHIIPLGSSTDTVNDGTKKLRNDKKHILNSPLNMTQISAIANRRIRDKKLSDYISYINELSTENHLIPGIESDIENMSDNYHTEFLSNRFKKIKDSLKDKLDRLIN